MDDIDFTELSNVDPKTKHIVTGYIKNIFSNDKIIPNAIINICILFYNDKEYFYIYGDDIKITKNAINISEPTKNRRWRNINSAWCKAIIDFNKYPNNIFKWKLKLNYTDPNIKYNQIDYGDVYAPDGALIRIGIDSKTDKRKHEVKNNGFYQMSTEANYSIDSCGQQCHYRKGGWGRWGYYYSKHFKNNDILRIEINTKKVTMHYILNDEDQGNAFDDIDTKCKYNLAVSLYGASVQIIDFEIE
eukprot:457496_1